MFKDDRMISILSGVVLMVVMGTIIQKSDKIAKYFAGGDADRIAYREDRVAVPPNTLTRIDVLANDVGLKATDRGQLTVVAKPACGQVFIQGGALQYFPGAECSGEQVIRYALKGDAHGNFGEAIAVIGGAEVVAEAGSDDTAGPSEPVKTAETAPDNASGTSGASGASGPSVLARAPSAPAQPARPVALPQVARPATGGAPASDDQPPRVATAPAPGATPSATTADGGGWAGSLARPPLVPKVETETGGDALSRLGGARRITPPRDAGTGTGATGATSATGAAGPALPQDSVAALPALPGAVRAEEDGIEHYGTATGQVPLPPRRPARLALAADAPHHIETPGEMVAGQSRDVAVIARQQDANEGEEAERSTRVGPPSAFRSPPMAILALTRAEAPERIAPPVVAGNAERIRLDARSAPPEGRSALPSQINDSASTAITLNPPAAGLSEVFGLGVPLRKEPIAGRDESPRTAAVAPDAPDAAVEPAAPAAGGKTESRTDAEPRVAGLTPAASACTAAPSVTLQVLPAAQTDVILSAPCHAGTVAELIYSGLRIALPIDKGGAGDVTALGFEVTAEATILFEDGEKLDFTLPFAGTDRLERVALVWDAPVALGLHAFEFGDRERGHVSLANPRDYGAVRRDGGGFLTAYAPVEGVGQNIQIYSYWIRRGGRSGLVEMALDASAACAAKSGSRPSFRVLRASRGRMSRPLRSRLTEAVCAQTAGGADHLIRGAVDDVIVSVN